MLPIYYSDQFLHHQTGSFHPERPARLEAIVKALRSAPFAALLDWRDPVAATVSQIERVHQSDYVQALQAICQRGGGSLDEDTVVSAESFEVAKLAVGAWIEASQSTLETGSPSLVLCRPPGHHAEPDRGMGFCLFSSAAIAALLALDQPQIKRVAVLDWDVHHGNGSEAVIKQHPHLAYVSLHQWPMWPGTGNGIDTFPHNNILNLPLPRGSGWPEYEQAMTTQVMPWLGTFDPDLLLVSAGFDCAAGDPLAGMTLSSEDFGRLTRLCLDLTPRSIFGLEGGYNLENLAQGWLSLVETCLDVTGSTGETGR
ncbi:MAG: histone deacetylase [Synechococcaceae cyanobacterium SM2_3_2]|nr:histone deacetylase [Synechococcaceae cyanobacterium SM2_3_2]